jgi:uncharacterized BrkB/YihY/UPF0761 family membrane protein
MNAVERGLRRIDAAQQRHKPAAFVVAVVKKYGDDNGGVLAASLAHSAFVSVFPLLLILVTVLGLIASADPAVRAEVLKAVAHQFPLIGTKLTGNVQALHRSSVIGLYLTSFRVLTPRGVPGRSLVPGAVAGGIGWTVLQAIGAVVVNHFRNTNSVYGYFGTVLGLIAWLYLAVERTVYAAEINVVLARRLWPRSIVQPPLTEADRSSLALQALQNQRREEQRVTVWFSDRPPGQPPSPGAPRTPAEVSPPSRRDGRPGGTG